MIDHRSYWRAYAAALRREGRALGFYSVHGSVSGIVFLIVIPMILGVLFGRVAALWAGAEEPLLWGFYSGAGAALIALIYVSIGEARWSRSDALDQRRLERRNPEAEALVSALAGLGTGPLPDAASVNARLRMATDERMLAWPMEWAQFPTGTLALVLLLHDWPRRAFAGTADAFATDQAARRTAGGALDRDWDLDLPVALSQHFFWPFIRCEQRPIIERAVINVAERVPEMPELLTAAEAHRSVLARFGRFPWRNVALGRENTADEEAWLADEGRAFLDRWGAN